MDIGSAQETLAGIGGAAGVGATLKMLWNSHCYRQDKAEILQQIEADRKALNVRVNELADEITQNAILVAREYVLKTDMEKLKEHIDGQFVETRNLIFTAMAGKQTG